jgi:putative membrane protein
VSVLITLFALVGSMAVSYAAGSLRVRQVSARSFARGPAAEALAASELRPVDRAFLGRAAEIGRQQMRLAEVGSSHATSSDVRSHAQQLATDYRSLNESLDALIRRKGGMAGAPVGGTSETYQKLVTQSGANFDREFVRTVSRMTDNVLALFEQVASESKDADVREFAAAQLPMIRAHRTSATELQKTFD